MLDDYYQFVAITEHVLTMTFQVKHNITYVYYITVTGLN